MYLYTMDDIYEFKHHGASNVWPLTDKIEPGQLWYSEIHQRYYVAMAYSQDSKTIGLFKLCNGHRVHHTAEYEFDREIIGSLRSEYSLRLKGYIV